MNFNFCAFSFLMEKMKNDCLLSFSKQLKFNYDKCKILNIQVA